MDLKHLRSFVAAAELGSVSSAAKKLVMTQPPLSNQIKELEDELGVLLLIRHPRGVRLTTAGATFLNDARDVLARAESAKNRAIHQKDAPDGFIRIGYAPSTVHMILPGLIRRMRALRPAVKVEVREMVSSMQGLALQYKEIDAGLVRPPINTGLVVLGPQLNDPFCLAVPNGHALAVKGPIDLRDTEQEVFVGYARPRGPAFPDQCLGLCSDAGFTPNVRYEASTLHGILDLVGAGLGVAIVPGSVATLAPAGLTLRLLRNPSRVGTIAFAQLSGDSNPLIETLAKLAMEVFAEFGEEISRCLAGLLTVL